MKLIYRLKIKIAYESIDDEETIVEKKSNYTTVEKLK